MGSSKNWKGRVEVYLSGGWGSVGDSSWTDEDAQVVCRQLGHSEQGVDYACLTYIAANKRYATKIYLLNQNKLLRFNNINIYLAI